MGRPSHVGARHGRHGRPDFVDNPAWVTKILADSWEVLEDTIPPAWRPRLDSVEVTAADRISAGVHEYGCGVYGCVFPTHDPMVVLKVSTDDTEAEFALDLAATLVVPICVEYRQVMALDARYKGRRVHLLWRESANHVGEMEKVLGIRAVDYLHTQHAAAQLAYAAIQGVLIPPLLDKLRKSWVGLVRPILGLADHDDDFQIFTQLSEVKIGRQVDMERRALSIWVAAVENMARQTKVPQLRRLANGMIEVYTRQHIFFGDVHDENVGLVARADGGHWVITDPGHVAVVSSSG